MADKTVTLEVVLDSDQFERDLRRLKKKIGAVGGVPDWCYVPWMRWFVQGNAVAAPLLALAWVLR